jgi:CheY-like chemotaxis protein
MKRTSELALPEVDGYSLIEAIRRLPHPQMAAIPAVALSDEASDADRRRALVAGYHLHVRRSSDFRSLQRTLSGLRRLAVPRASHAAG